MVIQKNDAFQVLELNDVNTIAAAETEAILRDDDGLGTGFGKLQQLKSL